MSRRLFTRLRRRGTAELGTLWAIEQGWRRTARWRDLFRVVGLLLGAVLWVMVAWPNSVTSAWREVVLTAWMASFLGALLASAVTRARGRERAELMQRLPPTEAASDPAE